MAENTDLTQELKDKLATFNPKSPLVVNCAEIAGLEEYVGRFVFRRQTNGDRIKIAVSVAKMTEGAPVDVYSSNLAFIIATFETVCLEKPKDIIWEEMNDASPLFDLYDKYVEWQSLFRIQLSNVKEGNSQKGQ